MDKRGRNACWRCKERRVRCTLEKPTCKKCARSNHPCQYGIKLLWKEEALARGICHGRQGVHGRQTIPAPLFNASLGLKAFTGDFYFFNTFNASFEAPGILSAVQNRISSVEDQGDHDEVAFSWDDDDDDDDPPGEFDQLGSVRDLPLKYPAWSKGDDVLDSRLLDYYMYGLCPNLSNSPTVNPYLEFMIPLSTVSAPLFYSIMSWSAHELSLRNKDPTNHHHYRQISIQHKVKALRGLRKEVNQSQNHVTKPSTQTLSCILAAMIILSCQDITESCSSAWMSHLKASRMLCSMLWPQESNSSNNAVDGFRRFCLMWLVSHEMMSRTAWVQETLFEPSEWFAGDDDSEIDAMIGCSRGLVHQVSEIGKLIMEKRLMGDDSTYPSYTRSVSFDGRRDGIEHAIQSLGQCLPTAGEAAASSWTELVDVAESKRLCALIYLYTSVDGATPATPAVQTMTWSVLSLLRRLPPKPSLTFPLFVVGTLGVWNEEDRRFVLDKFTQLIKNRPLASIVRASEIVRAVWLDRDLGKCERWEDLVETRGKLLSLA